MKRRREKIERYGKKDKRRSLNKRFRLPGAGQHPFLSHEIEAKIIDWFKQKRNNLLPVSHGIFKRAAEIIARQEGSRTFRANPGWFCSFMERHGIAYRASTSYSRVYSDQELEMKQREYVQVLNELIKDKLCKSSIFNMDETPLYKDMPPAHTYDFKGAKSVPIKTTKHEKDRMTLVLCVGWGGDKIPPLIIFKSSSKTEPKLVTHQRDEMVIY